MPPSVNEQRISLVAHSNRRNTRNRILENVVQPGEMKHYKVITRSQSYVKSPVYVLRKVLKFLFALEIDLCVHMLEVEILSFPMKIISFSNFLCEIFFSKVATFAVIYHITSNIIIL